MSAVRPKAQAEITPRDVALRLYEKGFVAATLPQRDPQLAGVIIDAYADTTIKLGTLPGRPVDFVEIRKQLELITWEADRYGKSAQCERYRPSFAKPLGRM